MKIIKNIGLFVVLLLFFVSNFADARRVKSSSILLTVNHYKAILNQDPGNELLLGNLIEQLKSVDAEEALTAALVLVGQRFITEEERLEAVEVAKDYFELFLDRSFKYQDMVDFHIHSFWSDAMATSSEIVFDAWVGGMEAIALLNHNTFNGVWEALRAGEILGLHVVPAIELDLSVESLDIDNMHVVVYFNKSDSNTFKEWLQSIEDDPAKRAIDELYQTYVGYGQAMIEAFNERRFIAEDGSGEALVLNEEDIVSRVGEMVIRYRLTEILFDKYGSDKLGGDDIVALSKKYFNFQLGTHFGRNSLPITSVIKFIATNGGTLVIPHPTEVTDKYGFKVLEELLRDYAVIEIDGKNYFGFRGIEVNSAKTPLNRREEYLSMIQELNRTHPVYKEFPLIVTSGSDGHYHFNDFADKKIPFIQNPNDNGLESLLQQIELTAKDIE